MELPSSVSWEKYHRDLLTVLCGTLANAISVGRASGTTVQIHREVHTGSPMSATRATRVATCVRLLLIPEQWEVRFVPTAGPPSPRRGRSGGRTLRLDAVLSATPEVDAEPPMPAPGFRERRRAMVGTRLRRGLTCPPCEESPTRMATFFKELRRGRSSSVSLRTSGEMSEVLQETENLQQAKAGNLLPGRELLRS